MKEAKVNFDAVINRFGSQGEKTGWTYIEISSKIASILLPGIRKGFRVKGYLDKHKIIRTALIPIGGGNFILPVNAVIRKATGKKMGDVISVKVSVDTSEIPIDKDLMECIKEEPVAMQNFNKFTPSHRNYFSKWIESAKTESTKAKRIAQTIEALMRGWNYSEMLRAEKK